MAGSGWETVSKNNTKIHMPDRSINATRMVMTNEGKNLIVTFFFTDGEYSSDSLPKFQAVELLKRFRSRVPVGALIRMEVPMTAGQDAAEKLSDELAATVVPPLIAELRNARLVAR